ncbi:MAG: TVP38/TMEM64 family protein [Terrimicrobiaceae bacterium]
MVDQWTEWMRQSMAWIEQTGPAGWLVFIGLYTLSCVLFLPGSVLSFGAGAIYGFWGGTALISAASVAGAAANFLSTRFLLRKWMERRFAGGRKFQALNHVATKDAWRMIILTRISPILPHSLVSCAFGLSRVGFSKFTVASWIGFVPISAAYSYGGSILGHIAKGGFQQGPWAWTVYAVEIGITVAVTLWITRTAQKAIKSVAPEVVEPEGPSGN